MNTSSCPVLLELKDISKSFPGVKALQNVSFHVGRGEVHCLLGENGAGKSTLIKILSGAYQKDSGSIFMNGQPVQIHNSRDAKKLGIGTVYQEMSLVPTLDAVENIFLGDELCKPNSNVLDRSRMKAMTKAVLQRLGAQVDISCPVQYLSTAQQQIIEIARSLVFEHKIIIMDEPTSSLAKKDVTELFRILAKLKEDGVTIIYISHKLEELEQIGDRITILRDGQYIDTVKVGETPMKTVISMMVGREFDINRKPQLRKTTGETVLEVRNVTSRDGKVQDVSFALTKGTILGFAGLVGSGRTELMKIIFGANQPLRGQIIVKGKQMRKMTTEIAVQSGIAYLSEDRKHEGLVLGMSIAGNFSLSNLSRISRGSVLNLHKEKRDAGEMKEKLRIVTPSVERLAAFLSGGNQQKVVIAKWLYSNCDILIFDEPTRGIDVGARSEIYNIMNALAKEGKSIIMVSSDLTEVLSMSNRIITMHEGRITGEIDNTLETTQEDIMSFMLGVKVP